MEGQLLATREELYHVQMDVKHVQAVQLSHADRLLRLEKRQADDAALKSVWNSPFPSVLSGTPQHGPVVTPSADVFEDFDDDQGNNLIGSLHLDAEDEPIRRGTSRANSVRFDVSANQGSNWVQGARSSGEFGPVRPSSGFGSHPMTERSLSHKSDGRHSSTGHSVHSVHSAHSGRTSSLGLDTNFIIGDSHDDQPLNIPEPPPGLFVLGSVPSIIRCWLNENFSHSALLYAVVCTGSQKSQIELSLLQDLGLTDHVLKDPKGRSTIRMPVYLPEAVVTQPTSRAGSPGPQLPTMTVQFEVMGVEQSLESDRRAGIRVFLGSDCLRAHSADVLLSQNVMTLYGDDRNRLSVPFVRPEDNRMFSNLCTTNIVPERVALKATALPFMPTESKSNGNPSVRNMTPGEHLRSQKGNSSSRTDKETAVSSSSGFQPGEAEEQTQVNAMNASMSQKSSLEKVPAVTGGADPRNRGDDVLQDTDEQEPQSGAESERAEPAGGIWGSWRSGSITNDHDSSRESFVPSTYSKAGRGGGRSMKVLKPSKTQQGNRSTSSARTGASYEPPPQHLSGEYRRKSQTVSSEIGGNGSLKWESKRVVSDEKTSKDSRSVSTSSRSSNPIGGASAFSWMNSGKSRSNSAVGD